MKTILVAFIFVSFIGFSQHKNPIIIKPTVGISYQNSDIKDNIGSAIGVGISKQLNSPKHWLSTSLGVSYLYSRNTGQNFTSSATANGSTSNTYLYQNYLSKSHYTSVSAHVGIQKLKALLNVNLYGFGGLGLLAFQSKTNQLDKDGNLYDYSQVGQGFFDSKTDLNLLYDETYESNTQAGGSQLLFSPSFGFGIGYQLSPQLSVNFEQNFIVPNTDLLDGNIWTNTHTDSKNNDRLNTSTLTIAIGLGKTVAPPSKQPVVLAPKIGKPFIDMKQPSYKLTTTSSSTYTIKATLRNITDMIQVSIERNKRVIIPKNLEFNKYSGQISFDVNLTQKEEHFKIYVNNDAGNHFRLFTINYTEGPDAPPTEKIKIEQKTAAPLSTTGNEITILSPQQDFIEACYAFIYFKSTSQLTKNQLITLSNNQPVTYTQNSNDYTIEKAIVGTETFRIITSNTETRQEKQITYRCRPDNEQLTIPYITLREPLTDTTITNENSLYIFANFKSRAEKVTIKINGQIHTTKSFLSGIATKINLPPGDLTITLEAQNGIGTDKKTFFVKRP